MKLAVILGVAQMSLGIFMKFMNAKYNSSWIDVMGEFVPQILLLSVMFGFMNFLIIIKWLTDFTNVEFTAPPIIATMINMFLGFGKLDAPFVPLLIDQPFQRMIMIIFLLVAFVCCPWMLAMKPYHIKKQMELHGPHKKEEHEEIHMAAMVDLVKNQQKEQQM